MVGYWKIHAQLSGIFHPRLLNKIFFFKEKKLESLHFLFFFFFLPKKLKTARGKEKKHSLIFSSPSTILK